MINFTNFFIQILLQGTLAIKNKNKILFHSNKEKFENKINFQIFGQYINDSQLKSYYPLYHQFSSLFYYHL